MTKKWKCPECKRESTSENKTKIKLCLACLSHMECIGMLDEIKLKPKKENMLRCKYCNNPFKSIIGIGNHVCTKKTTWNGKRMFREFKNKK